VLKEIEDDLRIIGIDIQHLGNNMVSINSLPSDCEAVSPSEMLEIILEEYKSKQADPSGGLKEKLAVSLARAAAIPYGKALSRSEMEDLIDNLFACRAPNYSPTGKPAISIIQLDEIDKRFK
jgi:DNA mismatch repair protein MutL